MEKEKNGVMLAHLEEWRRSGMWIRKYSG